MTRKLAIELLKHDIYLDKQGRVYSHDAVGIKAHEMAIKALEQEPKTGHWIWNFDKGYCKCSECGIGMGHKEFDYCPNCGARMESEDK